MKTKKPIKVQLMWAPIARRLLWPSGHLELEPCKTCSVDQPVFVLEAVDIPALVEQVAQAIWRGRKKHALPPMPIATLQAMYRKQARAVLSSLGLIPARRRK